MTEQTTSHTRKDIEAHIIAQSWKDEAYKQQLLNNPKSVIEREFGVQLPSEVKVQVLEENPTTLYFVLPVRPNLSGAELSDEQLEAVAGGTSPGTFAIGVLASAASAAADKISDLVK
ncbi:NHLP leader peptide family RiPP precursor [Nostoc sp. FACHB-888]|uniref:NHLP leader peptide family RiPP precursor n=1 Tax=Nostoc sp. FACHB-888 TaxID=2692842 RepID=UPI0016877CA6|nr:NHLP leader peptide family RiPP precursor [Nostoc sp. FACHB-888]MBD2243788.1 NHLP leader peptide family natural product precursor [Nostoc sp. FACHB-888]